MSGIYRRRQGDLDACMRGMTSTPEQIGAIFAINGRVVGLEMLDARATWEKCFAKVASGYALDALDRYLPDSETPPVSVAEKVVHLCAFDLSEDASRRGGSRRDPSRPRSATRRGGGDSH